MHPIIDTIGSPWTACKIYAAISWSAAATLRRSWVWRVSRKCKRSLSTAAIYLQRGQTTIKECYSEINWSSWRSNYLQNSSAEKCSFQNEPGGALVNDNQYETFKPFVEEQSAKTMNHHLGRTEMNLLWLLHRTIPSSPSTHPEKNSVDVFSGIIWPWLTSRTLSFSWHDLLEG